MNLKNVLFAGCLVMLGMPSLSYGHCGMCGKDGHESKAESKGVQDPMAVMSKELNLSEDQKAKIKAVKEDMHKKMESLHQETHTRINAVLTKEQQTQFEKLKPMTCGMCAHGDKPHVH